MGNWDLPFLTRKMRLKLLGMGIRNEKVNWDWDCETLQYLDFSIFLLGIDVFDYFGAVHWDHYPPLENLLAST